jgi:hypothetical protein
MSGKVSKNQKKKLNKATKKASSNGKKQQVLDSHIQKIVTLGRCTHDYARALGNPKSGPLACVPIHPAQFSKKVRTWIKGTFNCQTNNGIGWIMLGPDFGIANDLTSVITSSATGTPALWFASGTVAANPQSYSSNSEYSQSDVGPTDQDLEYRVVSAVLQVRYIGTELNRGGQMVCLMDPNHRNLVDRSLSDLDAEETSRRFPVDRSWTKVLYRGVDVNDYNFHDAFPTASGLPSEETYYMGVAIEAPAGVSTPYEFECYMTYEVFGKNVRAMTQSHVDTTGFGAVHAVSQLGQNLYPTKAGDQENEVNMVREVARYVGDQTTTVSHVSKSGTKPSGNSDGGDTVKGIAASAVAGLSTGAAILGALSFLL